MLSADVDNACVTNDDAGVTAPAVVPTVVAPTDAVPTAVVPTACVPVTDGASLIAGTVTIAGVTGGPILIDADNNAAMGADMRRTLDLTHQDACDPVARTEFRKLCKAQVKSERESLHIDAYLNMFD